MPLRAQHEPARRRAWTPASCARARRPRRPAAAPPAPPPDPHRALQPLIEAAARTRAKVAVLRVPMHWRGRPWLPGPLELLIKAAAFLGPHARLAASSGAAATTT